MFGIFAANGLTKLVWGVAAAVLLVVALLPRVGKDKRGDDRTRSRDTSWDERHERSRFDRTADDSTGSRSADRQRAGDRR